MVSINNEKRYKSDDEKWKEKKDEEENDQCNDVGGEEGEERLRYGFDGFFEFDGSIKIGVEDAIDDGDESAVSNNGTQNYEKEIHRDNCGGVSGRFLLLKVFENELGEEGEERSG